MDTTAGLMRLREVALASGKMRVSGPAPIDSIEKVSLGGLDQWISLRSQNTHHPVMLFLHGGPGTANISFARKSQRMIERDFTVVNWDQRGAGRSYSGHLGAEDMTIDRFVTDAEELIEVLQRRFAQEKIFLVGQSWGSIVGATLAGRRPELLRAYVGAGQVVNMARGEEVSYVFTLDEAEKRGHERAIRELTKIGHPPYKDLSAAGVQRKWLGRFNGVTYKGSPMVTLLRYLSIRDTRPLDIVRFVRGAVLSLRTLEDEQMRIDFFKDLPEIAVPVQFWCGRRDYNTPHELVVEYLRELRAPTKRIVWFERSGHLPNFEEPAAFSRACRALLDETL
jgi:pimeloyl-ACP methyl ester carboxylesterase